MSRSNPPAPRPSDRPSQGKLRIGDDWNAINIIATSQQNPLKAVAEFIENSIDAKASQIVITRGREKGESYLKIADDGDGVPHDLEGAPNFQRVATSICNSLKRQLKAGGAQGLQGEFGIGLLSFWTVGQTLSMVSYGHDGHAYELRMAKGDPKYEVRPMRRLAPGRGVTLTIRPLLQGIRQFTGEKLQAYLASELRDRIRQTGVEITIVDKQARLQYRVVPRHFSGQLLHRLPGVSTDFGEAHCELYLAEADGANHVELHRSGTRVLPNLAEIGELDRAPWTSGCLQGVIDAPFLNLTPGSRSGVIHDERLAAFIGALGELEQALTEQIEQQRAAAEERTNRDTLKTIQRAFREALLALPQEEYDWFEGRKGGRGNGVPLGSSFPYTAADRPTEPADQAEAAAVAVDASGQMAFFEHAGPLASARISPTSSVVSVGKSKSLRAVARDRSGREIDGELAYAWHLVEGEGQLVGADQPVVEFQAPTEPQLARVELTITQGELTATARAQLTVTDSLEPEPPKAGAQRGLPDYTFEKQPGSLWRSRFDTERNVIVINNGHRDFAHAARQKTQKLRYICRLFAKELVLHNFPGHQADQLLERMVELSLYVEENLR